MAAEKPRYNLGKARRLQAKSSKRLMAWQSKLANELVPRGELSGWTGQLSSKRAVMLHHYGQSEAFNAFVNETLRDLTPRAQVHVLDRLRTDPEFPALVAKEAYPHFVGFLAGIPDRVPCVQAISELANSGHTIEDGGMGL